MNERVRERYHRRKNKPKDDAAGQEVEDLDAAEESSESQDLEYDEADSIFGGRAHTDDREDDPDVDGVAQAQLVACS